MYEISEEKLENIKSRICDECCIWPITSTEEILEKHCAECALNDFDYPLGKNDYQE